MTSPIQYMHGESFVYPVVTTSCSEEIVQNSVEFKQAYIALPSQDHPASTVALSIMPKGDFTSFTLTQRGSQTIHSEVLQV